MTEAVLAKVRKLIVEHLGVEESDVQPATKIEEDLGADSLDTTQIVMACEEEFDIDIPDMETHAVETVGQLVELVEKHVAA